MNFTLRPQETVSQTGATDTSADSICLKRNGAQKYGINVLVQLFVENLSSLKNIDKN